MTIPSERYRALSQMRRVLTDYALEPGPVRKKELRELVSRLLRHYPMQFEIDEMARKCPELLGQKMHLKG